MNSIAKGAVLLLAGIGWLGTVLPLLPGTLLILAVAFGYWVLTGFAGFDSSVLLWLGLLTVLAEGAEYLLGATGARRSGASRAGTAGAVAGGLLGIIILGLPGIILGPILGAAAGEILAGRDFSSALNAGLGAALGTLGGIVVRFTVGGVMFWIVWKAVL